MFTSVPRRTWSFLLLAYGISWSVVGVGYALGVRHAAGLGYTLVAALYMLGPATAAIIQQRLFDRAPWSGIGLPLKGMRWKYVWLTVLIGVVIFPLAMLVAALGGDAIGIDAFGHVEVSQGRLLVAMEEALGAAGPQQPSGIGELLDRVHIPGGMWLLLFQLVAVVAAFSFNLPMMLGEELGWRGYLYGTSRTWTVASRVLFTGAVWGLWHAPLILMGHNYPQYPVLGIPLMVVFCVLLALLFDWSRTRTGAVWGPCILHGIINGSAGSYMLFAWGGHPLVNSPTGMTGFVAIAALGMIVLLFDRRYLQGMLSSISVVPEPSGAIGNK